MSNKATHIRFPNEENYRELIDKAGREATEAVANSLNILEGDVEAIADDVKSVDENLTKEVGNRETEDNAIKAQLAEESRIRQQHDEMLSENQLDYYYQLQKEKQDRADGDRAELDVETEWQQGTVTYSGNNSTSATRIRTDYIKVFGRVSITPAEGYQINLRYYDANKVFTGHSGVGWLNVASVDEATAAYVRVIARKVTDENIVPSEGANVTIVRVVVLKDVAEDVEQLKAGGGSGYDDTEIRQEIGELKDDIGDLSGLTTTDKSNLVEAINEAARGGGSEAWVTVYDETLTEDAPTDGIMVDFGKAVRKIMISIYAPQNDANRHLQVHFNVKRSVYKGGLPYAFTTSSEGTKSCLLLEKIDHVIGWGNIVQMYGNSKWYNTTAPYGTPMDGNTTNIVVTSIQVTQNFNGAYYPMKSGTKILIKVVYEE